MQRDLDLFCREFDLLIIGAGVHGACIARLASQAGLTVALIEQDDFGSATSRNSAKLVHGGLRYIQHFDVRRIRESVVSQRAWFRFAPHLMRPLKFVMPTQGHGGRSPLVLGGGILAYQMLALGRNQGIQDGIRLRSGGLMGRKRLVAGASFLDHPGYNGGAWWYDGQMHDAVRVTLECIHDAVQSGAVAANHLRAEALLHDARGVHGVLARDRLEGREVEIRARLTINASGPWVDEVLAAGPQALRSVHTTRWTRNMNLVTRRLYPGQEAFGVMSRQSSDAAIGRSKRLFFVSPWHGTTVVGTSHELHEGAAGALAAPREVIMRFLEEVDEAAPGLGLRPEDIRSVHLGLTPTEGSENNFAKRSLVIDHSAVHGVPGLVSVVGIKYSTAPVVASRVVSMALARLAIAAEVPEFSRPCDGAPNATQELAVDIHDDADEFAWTRAIYGRRADACLGSLAEAVPDAEQVFCSRVRYGIAEEMVVRLSDAVLRATDWAERGLLSQHHLDWCAATMASSLGWSDQQKASELAATRELLQRLHVSVADRATAASRGGQAAANELIQSAIWNSPTGVGSCESS